MKGAGCLLILVGFTVGAVVVGVADYFYARGVKYINRDQATQLALNRVQEACRETRHVRPVDCSDWRSVNVEESKDGWHFVFRSHEGRRTRGAWIGRIGEVDDDDSDDPDEWVPAARPRT